MDGDWRWHAGFYLDRQWKWWRKFWDAKVKKKEAVAAPALTGEEMNEDAAARKKGGGIDLC